MIKLFIIILLLILSLLSSYNSYEIFIDKNFYDINEISFDLNNIYENIDQIKYESLNIADWIDWPEHYLYDTTNNKNGTWKIIPFYGFGIWVDETCMKCPFITNFLKNIKGLKLATLSKLSPHMKLIEHRGWRNHSNYVIRCHFGINVPDNCYISVNNEIKFHKQNEWIIFDDSKLHYAENKSNNDRIVLIVDIERPSHIKIGESTEEDSKELIDFIEQFKKFT